jgi:hypothetical protein
VRRWLDVGQLPAGDDQPDDPRAKRHAGRFLSISASGSSNGVVWASIEKHGQWTDTPGVVVASDAATLKELWRDNADVPFTKFMPVTVAGGKIFRASMAPFTEDPGSLGELIVYGALPATTWGATTIGGPGAEFVADSRGRLFALTPDRQAVMAYMGWGGNWIQIGGPATHLYAGGPFLFATAPGNGAILRWDDPLWTQVGGAGSTFAVDDRGTLYGLTPDQQAVFQYSGQGQNWTPVGGPATSLWAGGFTLFATSPTGDVFRFGPEAPRNPGGADQWIWRQAGTPGAAFAADGTGRLYGITPDGQAINAARRLGLRRVQPDAGRARGGRPRRRSRHRQRLSLRAPVSRPGVPISAW